MTSGRIFLLYNGNLSSEKVNLPSGIWEVKVKGNEVNEDGLRTSKSGKVSVPASGMMILVKK